MAEFRLETERLVLRLWRDGDLAPLTEMNADPEVMAFIGPARSRQENLEQLNIFNTMHAECGYSCWAMQRLPEGDPLRRHILYRIARPR